MEKPPETRRERANRQATRVVVGVFLALSAVFIVDSTWELAKGAFELGASEPLGSAPDATSCYDDVAARRKDIELAVIEAAKVAPEASPQTFARALGPGFSESALHDLEARCARSPRGLTIYSALLRVRLAEEAAIAERATELGPMQGDLARALAK